MMYLKDKIYIFNGLMNDIADLPLILEYIFLVLSIIIISDNYEL